MTLTPGSRLGLFEITAQIGEGDLGQVYRADDTKLKRQVAIKILPPSLAADRDRLARFQREAEVLASLNHPHIAGIHGLEESDGITALVMELVEGDDLSQHIARGAIPIDEALLIAKQIAEALEAAHEQGIIHRDLKPANIKVRSDGTVTLLEQINAAAISFGVWAEDNTIIFGTTSSGLRRVSAEGGTASDLTTLDTATEVYLRFPHSRRRARPCSSPSGTSMPPLESTARAWTRGRAASWLRTPMRRRC